MIVGHMIRRLQSTIGDESPEAKSDIYEHLNTHYLALGGKHVWQSLLTLVTGQGEILPADMLFPVYVEDDTDRLYFRSGIPMRYRSGHLYNWFINMSVTTPLLVASTLDGTVTAGDTALTSVANTFTAAMEGEYVRIGENLGIYKISAFVDANGVTLEKGFRGDSETAAYFEVRPEGTKKLLLHDDPGDAITTSTLKFWYVRSPLPLYNDHDAILLPGTCDALFILALRSLLETEKYVNDSLKQIPDFDAAWASMKALSPVPKQVNYPRDRHGAVKMLGRRRGIGSSDNFHSYDHLR